jgi:major vault protein
MKKSQKTTKVMNIAPYEYIHIKDLNKSIVTVITGPVNYIVQEHEEVIGDAVKKMVVIPPMHYVCIRNPVIINKDGNPEVDKYGQTKVAHSELQYRFHDDYKFPFYLYWGEELVGDVTKLQLIKTNEALKLKAKRNFTDSDGNTRQAGDEWLIYGPKTYYPKQEQEIINKVNAIIIEQCQALKLKASQNFTSRDGVQRKAGEEWLVRSVGAFIPDVYENVQSLEKPVFITDSQALHIRASKYFVDIYGKEHRAGEEWLITPDKSTWHVFDIYEEYVTMSYMKIINKDQYAVILNPIDEFGKNQNGSKKIVYGEKSFFLQPGESLENGIQNVMILNEIEAVLLQAKEKFQDTNGEVRVPGDKWMIKGPCRYVPNIEVEVIEKRSVIPLDSKEGIYVRDTKTGVVRSVIGKSYMLESYEELWSKELPPTIEVLVSQNSEKSGARDHTKVVTYKCPYNAIMQIFNFKNEKSRIIFGPQLVMLEPDEEFNLLELSGKTPKVPGVVKTLYFNMGPSYTTDKIEVETSDHALLIIEVAYNWYFDLTKDDNFEKQSKVFKVRDCIGELCSLMASRVRGAVAEMTLSQFHKNSARTIRIAVMGEENSRIKDKYLFENNLLAISNVDIKNISTKDESTKEKLQVTVNLAIELTTKSQEEEAKRQAESRDQDAKSMLQRKIIEDNKLAEELKKTLFELQSKTRSIEESGLKEASAKANVNTKMIESQSKIKIATTMRDLQNLKNKFKNQIESLEHQIHLDHEKSKNQLEIESKQKLSEIETKRFQNIIDAIGKDTLVKLSEAGPESQVALLKSLGLEGFIMTDGSNPINLFNFANSIANTK